MAQPLLSPRYEEGEKMRKVTILMVAVAVFLVSGNLAARGERIEFAKYKPVIQFVDPDSTLTAWYKQFVDTTTGDRSFNTFLMRLKGSDVFFERVRRAGVSEDDLSDLISDLTVIDWANIHKMDQQKWEGVRLAMVEFDVALGHTEGSLPKSARKEFRQEVFSKAEPLTAVAVGGARNKQSSVSAIDAMTLNLSEQKLSERINNAPPARAVSKPGTPTNTNMILLQNPYMPW